MGNSTSWQSRSLVSLQWRHNERDGVSNHKPYDCLLNRLFRRRSKKTSKLRVTGLCGGNLPIFFEHTLIVSTVLWLIHHLIWPSTQRRDKNVSPSYWKYYATSLKTPNIYVNIWITMHCDVTILWSTLFNGIRADLSGTLINAMATRIHGDHGSSVNRLAL